jgi:NTE family protein
MIRLGLALGGGGARGLAHVKVLEAVDELGVKPAIIAGTSIGAIIGSAYASGMPATEIALFCKKVLAKRSTLLRHVYSRWKGSLWSRWRGRPFAAFKSERVFELLLPHGLPQHVEDLPIPFRIVTTDFRAQAPYVITRGPLVPAIAASAALPGLLTPLKIDGRILIDGGFVNPLPIDVVKGDADAILAVDVNGAVAADGERSPRLIETLLGAQQIALRSIINEKLKVCPPDILVRPQVGHYRVLDFLRVEEIWRDASGAKEEAKRALHALLDKR